MSADNVRVFECFKVGTHTSMAGVALRWEASDLDAICRNYVYRATLAPLVLGHPPANGPAYGEVKELFHKRGVLYAVATVGGTLLDLVRNGFYKHVSASFEKAQNLHGMTLRHIGFLGANPPAVKGLAQLVFADFSQPAGTVSFSSSTGVGVSSPRQALAVPAGWHVTKEGWELYERATEVHKDCPGLSFAEAAMLAEKHIIQF